MIAVCAAETDPLPGDLYLDDECHYALAAKFARDWKDRFPLPDFPNEWLLMDTQKLRDAKTTIEAILEEFESKDDGRWLTEGGKLIK